MDQSQLLELARQALQYMGPLIAAGALKKVGEQTIDAAKDLTRKTWELVQSRFKGHEKAERALALYEADPKDETVQKIVESEIVAQFQNDPDAVTKLASLVQQAGKMSLVPQQEAEALYNVVVRDQGQVGVIARDVHAPISVDMGGGKRPSADSRQAPSEPPEAKRGDQ